MRDKTTSTLDKIEAELRQSLDALSRSTDPPDKVARSISIVLKTLGEISSHRERLSELAASERLEKYTRYEDLPPPSPEDMARFYDRFHKLYAEITQSEGQDTPDPS